MYGFSPVWILLCIVKLLLVVNVFFTLKTFIGLLTNVNPFMHKQTTGISKSFFTLITRIWFLTRVNSFVPSQSTACFICLFTLITTVWFFTCMNYFEFCQIFLLNKHWSQAKGFSPEWILLWIVKALPVANVFQHWSHEKGFSPMWIPLCQVKALLVLYVFSF